MANLTVRNVPDDLVERLKQRARNNGHSMEQELREMLAKQYPSRAEVLDRVRERWDRIPPVPAEEIDAWIREGRDRSI